MASRVPLAGIRNKILPRPARRISVTNFAASICEIKSLYKKAKAPGREPSSAALAALEFGTAVHEKLDDMAFEPLPLLNVSRHFEQALKLLQTAQRWDRLAALGSGREIPLYGEYKGIRLYGIADGLEAVGGAAHALQIVENKTTLGALPPQEYKMRLAYHQALIYHYIFSQMMDPGFDLRGYITLEGADPHEPLVAETGAAAPAGPAHTLVPLEALRHLPMGQLTLETVYAILVRSLEGLRASVRANGWVLSDTIALEYTNRSISQTYEVEYDQETLRQLLEYCGELWLGAREPSPFRSDGELVCRWCEFAHLCEFKRRADAMGVAL